MAVSSYARLDKVSQQGHGTGTDPSTFRAIHDEKERPPKSVETFISDWHFAVWGSLAIILAHAFDPFVQNPIHYYPNLVVDPSQNAFLSNSTRYETAGLLGRAASRVDPVLKANVYSSLFNADLSKPWAIPQYLCSSSNCTRGPVAFLDAVNKSNCSMHNVAAAISKSFRDSAYISVNSDHIKAEMAAGRVMRSITFVAVQWQWTVLPVMVWLLGVVTLVDRYSMEDAEGRSSQVAEGPFTVGVSVARREERSIGQGYQPKSGQFEGQNVRERSKEAFGELI
ncbi:hypothetical protein CNMCM7691_007736 [Aspergillus felis]|uniref:Uncharacterized protein n=1 Tax=Aspergillus felis TaxID=1287682 RepID=A0A8H6QVU7_9EURO|nr:hypothetical protein CNMCM7691_007736 [Aspergillus felis]